MVGFGRSGRKTGRKEAKKRVGARCDWISGVPSEFVHRDPGARSAANAEIMSKKSNSEPARPADSSAKVPFLRFFL